MAKELTEQQRIERSIITKFRKGIWSRFLQAVKAYKLIEEGDKIAVCVSGGKDSMLLAKLVQELERHGSRNFTAEYICMDPGYNAENLDAIYLCYNKFINTMRQEPVIDQLLPLPKDTLKVETKTHSWEYIYEPDAASVIDTLLQRYIEALLYQSVAENIGSEQSARMVAMKAASDNAGNVISDLRLIYNKTRQAAITTELSEIVAGAAAV